MNRVADKATGCARARRTFCVTTVKRRSLRARALPEEAICGDKALKAHALLGVCAARPGGLCAVDSAALGSGLMQAPFFGFLAFFFTVVTQNVRQALAQSVALSATLCKFAHAPLVPANFHICCPPAGLGVRLFP